MKFWVVECAHRPRQDREGARKDFKVIHPLGDCPSAKEARELAHIWYGVARQSTRLGNLVRPTRFGEVADIQLQDEEGYTYPWAEPEIYIHDGFAFLFD